MAWDAHGSGILHQQLSKMYKEKSQPDVTPLLNIEATQPLELVHLDYLQIEPSKGSIENELIVTDHFTRYAQSYPSTTQTALARAKLLWNNFIIHYGFPTNIISVQDHNFESELIASLCQVAGVQKLRTSPYHPQTNGQCEQSNSTLLDMLGMLTAEQRKDGKTCSCPGSCLLLHQQCSYWHIAHVTYWKGA